MEWQFSYWVTKYFCAKVGTKLLHNTSNSGPLNLSQFSFLSILAYREYAP